MKKSRRRFLVLLASAFPLLLLGWCAAQLSATRLHLLGIDGRICPCEFQSVELATDGSWHLHLPQGCGEVIWVNPGELAQGAMEAPAYVLPWFGRIRTRIDHAGKAVIRP